MNHTRKAFAAAIALDFITEVAPDLATLSTREVGPLTKTGKRAADIGGSSLPLGPALARARKEAQGWVEEAIDTGELAAVAARKGWTQGEALQRAEVEAELMAWEGVVRALHAAEDGDETPRRRTPMTPTRAAQGEYARIWRGE